MSDRYHPAIERTSPKGKGQPFIGYCRVCGKTGLTFADMREDGREPCTPNIDHDRLLLDALSPKDETNERS